MPGRARSKSRTTRRKTPGSNYVLTDKVKKGLATWQYHSGGYTKLDLILDPFWAWCQTLMPQWMAPNLITLTGLFCVGGGALLLRMFDPTFSQTAPAWVYAVALLGHFLYQTLDAVDGKHARATKSSSPLGQLFDHGCDAFTTNIVGNLNCHCMQYAGSPWTVFNTVLNFQCFFLAQWEEVRRRGGRETIEGGVLLHPCPFACHRYSNPVFSLVTLLLIPHSTTLASWLPTTAYSALLRGRSRNLP